MCSGLAVWACARLELVVRDAEAVQGLSIVRGFWSTCESRNLQLPRLNTAETRESKHTQRAVTVHQGGIWNCLRAIPGLHLAWRVGHGQVKLLVALSAR